MNIYFKFIYIYIYRERERERLKVHFKMVQNKVKYLHYRNIHFIQTKTTSSTLLII